MAEEKFDIKKLFDFSPVGFYKVIGLAIKAGVIILIIFGILWVKNLLLPAPEVHKPEFNVAEGGTLVYHENGKRKLQFFVGPSYSTDDEGNWRAGAFGGIIW